MIDNKMEKANIKTYTYEEAFAKSLEYFNGDELAANVFLSKYALKNDNNEILEATPEGMHRRIAREFARVENKKFAKPLSEDDIFSYLDRFKYIVPQGSPMFGIGNNYQIISLSNCYVTTCPYDSYVSIISTDNEMAQISKRRGGVGSDLDKIRPVNTFVRNAARSSTGIIPFMKRYSNTIREVGQCLLGNTLVLTKSGLREISTIEKGCEVWTENKWTKVNDVIKNKKKCIKISTKHGRELICSKEHVIHSVLGEREAGDFEAGDSITSIVGEGWSGEKIRLVNSEYVKSRVNESNRLKQYSIPSFLDEKLAYVVGYSYGDGSVSRKVFNSSNYEEISLDLALSNDWDGIKEKLKNYLKDVFDYEATITKGDGDCSRIRISSKLIIKFLKENNLLKEKTNDIKFPISLLKADPSVVFAFISGFFDADGSSVKSKKVHKITSINREFLQNIQNVFASHGIVSKIHHTDRTECGWKDIYNLSINGNKSQRILKQRMKESIKIVSSSFSPKKRDFLRTTYKINDFGSNSSRHSYIIDNDQFVTYSTSDRLKSDLQLDKNVYLIQDVVESISEYDNSTEQDVYDLCLDDTHLFYANGLYVHNSGRRGALMLTLSIHHPESVILLDEEKDAKPIVIPGDAKTNTRDIHTTTEFYNPNIVDFCTVKFDRTQVTGANISLKLTDEFFEAVKNGTTYEQRWPVDAREKGQEPVISKFVDARRVWRKIIHAAWQVAEPGLLMWDHVQSWNAIDCYSKFGFKTVCTNPCSELPLCVHDSCRLLIQNLYSYVANPFTKDAYFDFELFNEHAKIAQRLMDDMIDLEIEKIDSIIAKIDSDPEPEKVKQFEKDLWVSIKNMCVQGRRTGTGITATGDMLAALNIKYGSDESINIVDKIHRVQKHACFRSSAEMAKEIGPFPVWDWSLEKDSEFLKQIEKEDQDLYKYIGLHGRRNIGLLTIAPTGSVSILTQTTSGIEPLYKLEPYTRRKKINPNDKNVKIDFTDQNGDTWQEFAIYHPRVVEWMKVTGKKDIKESPWHGCTANDLDWKQRVKLQSVAQIHIDHAISSTINLPEDVKEEKVAEIYESAWNFNCKGMTVYRDKCRTGVLVDKEEKSNSKLEKTNAPKRPSTLECDIHHTKSRGEDFFVIVGLLEGVPYEVFAGKNGCVTHEKKGEIIKNKRGHYSLKSKNSEIIENVCDLLTDEQAVITRMISLSLRHGSDVSFVVDQLEKSPGDMTNFGKAMARILKKYITNGTKASGYSCESCGSSEITRQEGCVMCKNCGNSKCS